MRIPSLSRAWCLVSQLTAKWASAPAQFLMLTAASRALSFFGVFYAAYKAGLADFGTFSFIQSTALSIGVLCSLSINTSLQAVYCSNQSGDVRYAGYLALFLGLFAFTLCAILSLLGAATINGLSLSPVMVLAAATIAFGTATSTGGQAYFFLKGRKAWAAAVPFFGAAVQMLLFLCFKRLNAESMVVISGFSQLVCASTLLLFIMHLDGAPVVQDFVEFLVGPCRRLWPYGIRFMFSQGLTHVGLWFLQLRLTTFGGAAEQGRYALGVQVFNLVTFLPFALGPLFVGHLLSLHRVTQSIFWRLWMIWSLFACFLGVALVVVYSEAHSYLPSRYSSVTYVIELTLLASILVASRVPISALFASTLRTTPEFVGNGMIFVLCLTLGMTWLSATSEGAALIRLLATAGQLFTSAIMAVFLLRVEQARVSNAKMEKELGG